MINVLIIIPINSVLFLALCDIIYLQIKKEERYVKMPK